MMEKKPAENSKSRANSKRVKVEGKDRKRLQCGWACTKVVVCGST